MSRAAAILTLLADVPEREIPETDEDRRDAIAMTGTLAALAEKLHLPHEAEAALALLTEIVTNPHADLDALSQRYTQLCAPVLDALDRYERKTPRLHLAE